MIVSQNARVIAARDLDDSLVGEAFSYETEDGNIMHARIAMVHIRKAAAGESALVEVTLDGVVHDGNSVLLVLRPEDGLVFAPAR